MDAALDLSHTQNIGAMIKKHFRNSQVRKRERERERDEREREPRETRIRETEGKRKSRE